MKFLNAVLVFLLLSGSLFAQNYNLNLLSNYPYPEGLSNVWGYTAPDGTEYALVGTTTRLSILSLADPANPVEVASVAGPNTIWREIKTWGQYAYVALDQVNVGVLIVNLQNLPNSVTSQYWTPSITVNGQSENLISSHTVTMDENGFMFINGSNVAQGQALIFDVHSNPGNPIYIGPVGNWYCHDNMMRGDTVWSGDIYEGHFSVWDVSDKSNPVLLATQNTPSNFTHNCWISDDGNTLFTTDEVADAYLTSYDVSDLGNIRELDRYRSLDNEGTGVVPHNAHVLNDWVFLSHYTDGLKIVDGHRPQNLVEVASYDTYPQAGTGFEGDWGVYPYFPSGVAIASDMTTGLWIFQPNLVRACYLEGQVTDANTGQALQGATAEFLTAPNYTTTDLSGDYAFGLATAGTYDVVYRMPGYLPDTLSAVLINGQVTVLNVQLIPLTPFVLTGRVVRADNGQPIAGATVAFDGVDFDYNVSTDGSGNFSINAFSPDNYSVFAGKWGFHTEGQTQGLFQPIQLLFELETGYRDEFAVDLGWTVGGNATAGQWERVEPTGVVANGNDLSAPDLDVQHDLGDKCYVTGDGGGNVGANDIDNGAVVLTSPAFDLTGYNDPYVRFEYWFTNFGGNGAANDSFSVRLSNGITTTVLLSETQNAYNWRGPNLYRIADFLTPTANMRLVFRAVDVPTGHVVEAAVDYVEIFDSVAIGLDPVAAVNEGMRLEVFPNPSSGGPLTVDYALNAPLSSDYAFCEVYNSLGQRLEIHQLGTASGQLALSSAWPAGVYQVVIRNGSRQQAITLVRQ